MLTEGKDYTVSNGSIVLKTSYLESLGYGSYTLVVTDANGVELARTSFTRSFTVRPARPPPSPATPAWRCTPSAQC